MASASSSSSWPAGSTCVVTGCSRGIGLELVRQLLTGGAARVVATARAPERAPQLAALLKEEAERQAAKDKGNETAAAAAAAEERETEGGWGGAGEGVAVGGRLAVVAMDVADPASVQAAAARIGALCGGRVDVLVNNAGLLDSRLETWQETFPQEARDILLTNALGPVAVSQALVPYMRRGRGPAGGQEGEAEGAGHKRMIVHVSSLMGSLAEQAASTREEVAAVVAAAATKEEEAKESKAAPPGGGGVIPHLSNGYIWYKASKAALNMEMLVMARQLAPEGIIVVSMSPGWVATDMGTECGRAVGLTPPLTPQQSVGNMMQALSALTLADSGSCLEAGRGPMPM